MPVLEGGEVVGIMSERDVINCLEERRGGGSRLAGRPGDDRSGHHDRIVGARPRRFVADDQRRIRHLPVVDNGELIGFVSIGDLVAYRIDRIEQEAEAMREYIQGA